MAKVINTENSRINKVVLELTGEEASALLKLVGHGGGGITTPIYNALRALKAGLPKVNVEIYSSLYFPTYKFTPEN